MTTTLSVWIGARDITRGRRAAEALGARFVQLDVRASEATAEAMRAVYETNVFGAVRVLHAFVPLLERSPAPVVVNVSSGLGSLGLASDPDSPSAELNFPVYSSSKAALNMLTLQYAKPFPRMRINSVDTGYTATDFNAHRGTQTVEEGAETIVRYALTAPDGPTGGFFDASGRARW
jgi:NAD(P)-dependent dehydrogenase (short-subunit alcohol dehydrogenase family)